MHELSIALNIIDIATAEARKAGAVRVTELHVDVGSLSGVIVEALDMAMQMAVKNTILEKAHVHIHSIPAKAKCRECGNEFEAADFFEECPSCSSFNVAFFQGKELLVRSLKVTT